MYWITAYIAIKEWLWFGQTYHFKGLNCCFAVSCCLLRPFLHMYLCIHVQHWGILCAHTHSPRSPAGYTDGLKHMNSKLADVHEEEDEETERAVTPGCVKDKERQRIQSVRTADGGLIQHQWHEVHVSPVKRNKVVCSVGMGIENRFLLRTGPQWIDSFGIVSQSP